MNVHREAFIRLVRHPLKFRLFLLFKLPAAFIAGVRVRSVDEQQAVVSVPFKWLTQNPFRSTYFASLSMAAEMSTGVLALAEIHKRNPAVSMLVVKVDATYYKKATDRSTFTCEDGDLFRQAIDETVATGEARTVKARSVGRNKAGEVVADFFITWSFKVKSQK
jgi:hypothetical protein